MKTQKSSSRNPFLIVRKRYFGNKVNEQRLMLLAYISVCTFIGVILADFGILGSISLVPKILNIAVFIAVLSLNLMFTYGHLSLYNTLGLVMIAAEVSLGVGFVFNVVPGDGFSQNRAMADLSISLVLGVCAVHAYLRFTSMIVCAMAMLCYVVGLHYTDNSFLSNFFPYFLFLAITGVLLGVVMVKNVNSLNDENKDLHQQTRRMSENFDLTPEQLNALVELSAEASPTKERQAELFELLGAKAKHRLFQRVSEVLNSRRTQLDLLERMLPELSQSELMICRLILRGKRLSEICMLLGKSKSNVTCQRAHIRAKLGLKPEDDLKNKLLERLDTVILKTDGF